MASHDVEIFTFPYCAAELFIPTFPQAQARLGYAPKILCSGPILPGLIIAAQIFTFTLSSLSYVMNFFYLILV